MNVFTKWHVAYHGTAVGNVRNILDCGELMFPGVYTVIACFLLLWKPKFGTRCCYVYTANFVQTVTDSCTVCLSLCTTNL